MLIVRQDAAMLDGLVLGDNYLLWMIPGVILTLFGNIRLRRKFRKYSKVKNASNLTGEKVARTILDSEDLRKVPVKPIKGSLSDHYDPRKDIVNLSQPIFGKRSLGAMAVAAHETGHAIQDKDGYFMMRLRGWIVPLANLGTNLGYLLIAVGLIVDLTNLARIGVLLFAMTTLFALITLPVEFNASKRAKEKLKELKISKPEEDEQVDDMLDAAAFTYVAAFATSAIQLFYWARTVSNESGDSEEKKARSSSSESDGSYEIVPAGAAESQAPVQKRPSLESLGEQATNDKDAPDDRNVKLGGREPRDHGSGEREASREGRRS